MKNKIKEKIQEGVEKLSNIKKIDLDERSKEILKNISAQQTDPNGKRYIFAPNHLAPQSKVREQMALADDFPVLNKVLRESGISQNVALARGDTDMPVKSRVTEIMYDAHRKAFSMLGKKVIGTIPVNINKFEPEMVKRKNVGSVHTLYSLLKDKVSNVTIYPYGEWYKAGEQQFEQEKSLPEKNFKPAVSIQNEQYEDWKQSVKPGAFGLAQLSGAEVVPVYVESSEEGVWKIRVGEPIPPENLEKKTILNRKEAQLHLAEKYVDQMKHLKESA